MPLGKLGERRFGAGLDIAAEQLGVVGHGRFRFPINPHQIVNSTDFCQIEGFPIRFRTEARSSQRSIRLVSLCALRLGVKPSEW
jgi:hypothetical protein